MSPHPNGTRFAAPQSMPRRATQPQPPQSEDASIHKEICHRLTQHPELDPSDIRVKVQDGQVILTGTVENRESKHLAEDIAREAAGAADVQNLLRTQGPGQRSEYGLQGEMGPQGEA